MLRLTRFLCVAGTVAAALSHVTLFAQNAEEGRKKAIQCQGCHGLDGIAKVPETPHIAGQPAAYTKKQLADYKSGTRKHEVMSVMAQSLSEQDIANLAAWYASIEVTATPPKKAGD